VTTYGDFKQELEDELDIDIDQGEVVSDTQFKRAVNRYTRECALHIYPMNQDYYRTTDIVSLVDATSEYAMPTGIFANKIRYVQFDDSSVDYEVFRIKLEEIPNVETTDDFQYDIINKISGGTKYKVYPTPTANDSTSMTRHFIRAINEVSGDASVIDLPDTTLLYHLCKIFLMRKKGDPMLAMEIQQTPYYQRLYHTNLEVMLPNWNEQMDPDLSHYEEHE
jgi:hypothetical protein